MNKMQSTIFRQFSNAMVRKTGQYMSPPCPIDHVWNHHMQPNLFDPIDGQSVVVGRRSLSSFRGGFNGKRRKKSKNMPQQNPFVILGVNEGEQYKVVKRNFLKLAMQNHPDTSNARNEDEKALNRENFIMIREAFETLVEGPNGEAILRSDSDEAWQEEELNDWFKQESGGFDMPFMDAKTMREVAEMTHKCGGDQGGLDRDGGMWTLARMVTQNVEEGGDGSSILQLEAGQERNREINGVLRRKKRR